MGKFAIVALGLLYAVSFVGVGNSADTKNTTYNKKIIPTDKSATGGLGKRPTVVIPLSEAECKGLGGKVVGSEDASCKSTEKACFVTDKDGVIHSSCITAN